MGSRNISFNEVKKHPDYIEGLVDHTADFSIRDSEVLSKILYDFGLDLDKSVEALYCEHRSPMTDEVVTGWFYLGYERLDKDWKETCYKVNSLERYGHEFGNLLDA